MKLIFSICVIFALLLSAPDAREMPEIIATITSDAQFTTLGWRIIPLGDQNGDGFDDFMS